MCSPCPPDRRSVLVVDDYADAADSLADLLHLCGFRVTVARTAREAMEMASESPPDVAVVDIRLPDHDGWHVTRWLRQQAQFCGRPTDLFVIAVTGCGTARDRWRSVQAGVDLHLVKPADPNLLVDVLQRFVQDGKKWGSADTHREQELMQPLGERNSYRPTTR